MVWFNIENITFPQESIRYMRLLRDITFNDQDIVNISIYDREESEIYLQEVRDRLLLIRKYMELFPEYEVNILLPRVKPAHVYVDSIIWDWFAGYSRKTIKELWSVCHRLKYDRLLNLLSLILAEDNMY